MHKYTPGGELFHRHMGREYQYHYTYWYRYYMSIILIIHV